MNHFGVGWRNEVWHRSTSKLWGRLSADRQATTREIASCFGVSMTLCRRSGVQSPGQLGGTADENRNGVPVALQCIGPLRG